MAHPDVWKVSMLNIRHAVLLCGLAVAGCQTVDQNQGINSAGVPQSWLDGSNYRCMRAHHLGQILTHRSQEIMKECQEPAEKGWAPAQTALALALPFEEKLNRSEMAMQLLRKAVDAGDPFAISIYGSEIRGEEGRNFIKKGVELGVIQGAAILWVFSSSFNESQQDYEDAYWSSFIMQHLLSQPLNEILFQNASSRHTLSAETRQRLKDDAMSVQFGQMASTPVSPQIGRDIDYFFRERNNIKVDLLTLNMREVLEKKVNPANRNFAYLLLEDPVVVEALRVHLLSPKAR